MVFKMFQFLFGMGTAAKRARPIEPLTDYLTNNETFKQSVINFHNTKTGLWSSIDKMLEKELLPPEHRELGTR